MLTVKTPKEATDIIMETFGALCAGTETVNLLESIGRILATDVISKENVPNFNRSTVDGYAVSAKSTFGCSESIPAILDYKGEVLMGETPKFSLGPNECAYVPTGGELPSGADAMVMIEFAEDYGDGTRAMLKPSAPGQSVTFLGDDVKIGDSILKSGTKICARHIGALASLGYEKVEVYRKLNVAVISTGDELVDVTETPKGAQVRDINSFVLSAALQELGCNFTKVGIVKDDILLLKETMEKAVRENDMVLVSGGSSVGVKDSTYKVLVDIGDVLFHGIAIKPGKPTILGNVDGKPVFGLPGHPLAAYYIFNLFVKPLILYMDGSQSKSDMKSAKLSLSIPCNHGREECMGIKFGVKDNETIANPVYAKSGLISVLSNTDGFVRIARDCEGLLQGEQIDVELF